MKVITFDHVRSLSVSPATCVHWVEEAFKLKYSAILPHKISIKLREGEVFFNTMPCYIPALNRFGVKEVSRYPEREPALSSDILLFDTLTGETLALMDGNWITAMRTGAVASLAISHFKKSDASGYAFIGLGNTARATLLCLLESNPGGKFRVKLLSYKDQAASFMERFKEYQHITFEVVSTAEELIRDADVIVSCVTVADDLIGKDEWFREGVLVVPVHTRGFQNCDLYFDKVFADDKGHVEGFKYFSRFKKFAELPEVILKKAPGRENDRERILAYNIGIALHDVYFAAQLYERLAAVGSAINTKDAQPKFWV